MSRSNLSMFLIVGSYKAVQTSIGWFMKDQVKWYDHLLAYFYAMIIKLWWNILWELWLYTAWQLDVITHEASADGSISGACVQHASVMLQEMILGFCLLLYDLVIKHDQIFT